MILTGEIIDAAQALEIGLVGAVVPAAELASTAQAPKRSECRAWNVSRERSIASFPIESKPGRFSPPELWLVAKWRSPTASPIT